MENYCTNCGNYSSRAVSSDCQDPAPDRIQWEDLPVAMGYVPMQKYCDTYHASDALKQGTVFPELCKPFCGKGGGCHR